MKLCGPVLFILSAIMAAIPCDLHAAREDSAGVYYDVPVHVISKQNGMGSLPDGDTTTDTAQLLIYSTDSRTTAIQLKVQTNKNTGGFIIRREEFPAAAHIAFGSVNQLRVPYQVLNQHLLGEQHAILPLLNEEGNVPGIPIHLFDASGQPVQDIEIRYQMGNVYTSSRSSSATANLSDDGLFIVPQPSFQNNRFASHGQFMLTAIEPVTGMTMKLNEQMHMTSRASGATVTLPMLNNWSADHPGIDKYSGTIYKDDGTPAAGVTFRVMVPFYGKSFFNAAPPQSFTAGPDGRFRLAYKTNPLKDDDRISVPEVRLSVQATGIGSEAHTLKPGPDNDIHTRRQRTITVKLLSEDGKPMDFSTTPALANQRNNAVGYLRGITDARHRNLVPVKLDETGTSTTLEPVQLNVPDEYYAMAAGYVFAPQKIGVDDDSVTFSPIIKDFTINGTVTSQTGDPISGAYVLLRDPGMIYHFGFGMQDMRKLQLLWESSNGDFQKLGAYMDRTDDQGRFSVHGSSLSQRATIFIAAAGYGSVNIMPKEGSVVGDDYWKQRFQGEKHLGTLQLAKQATATLEILVPETTSTIGAFRMPSHVNATVRADFIGWNEATASPDFLDSHVPVWVTNQTQTPVAAPPEAQTSGTELHRVTLTVPAETTFTLALKTFPGPEEARTIQVTTPFKPNEIRDLGRVK